MARRGGIGLGEMQAELLASAGKYCREKSPIDRVRRLLDDETGYDPAVWKEMVELGYLGIALPEAYGGAGLGIAEVVPVVEQMGRNLMGGPLLATTLAAQALLLAGTEQQKSTVLPGIASGTPASVALMEANGDWDPEAMECAAERDGGALVLQGRKTFVLDAHVARWVVASVRFADAPALVLLDAAALGRAEVRRETVIDETRRCFQLGLDGLRLPEDALLDVSATRAALARLELVGSLLVAAEMCGGGASCVDDTVSYLQTRTQFGRPIGSYQALKHPTVQAHVGMEQARSHLYAAAHGFDQPEEAEIAVRMAKAHAGTAFGFAADRAIQFHGAFGFTYECDAQLYRRRALWCEAQFGDALHHRRKLADLIL